jgi:hypothetical protein
VEQIPEGMHSRKAYTDRLGRRYSAAIKHNPRGRRKAVPAPPPSPSPPRRSKVKLTLSLTVTATAIGVAVAVGASGGNSAGGGDSLTVQVKVDISQAISAIAKLGFRSTSNGNSSNPHYGADCAKNATLDVKQFLIQHRCKEYASAIVMVGKGTTTTHLVITRVIMPTKALAIKYESTADTPESGNPPGEPPTVFNGLCYASSRNGDTVRTEQVQPTGDVNADQGLLQAAATPTKLTHSYLKKHCIQ